MIQIYYGDGKGKTTAACGLSVRAAGHGLPVLFVQFLKDDSSGEIAMLKKLGIQTCHPSFFYGFVKNMSEEEQLKTQEDSMHMLKYVQRWVEQAVKDEKAPDEKILEWEARSSVRAVVVLDEILHAIHFGLLSESIVLELLDTFREKIEFVLTGRNPSEELLKCADYITEMKNVRHPYEQGIFARKGIEL